MVYSNKVVAVIKADGQVLREDDGVVTLPFGSQYSILIKNLHSVRIKVNISIDGKNATEETSLIVAPNSSLELERYIRNGNLNEGNKFKFIERTSKIEAHRGIGVEDGLIRIEYYVEKTKPVEIHKTVIHHDYYYEPYYVPHYPRRWPDWYGEWPVWTYTPNQAIYGTMYETNTSSYKSDGFPGPAISSGSLEQAGQNVIKGSCSVNNSNHKNLRCTSFNINDSGITVPGDASNQKFYQASNFETETQSHVIVLKLRGCVGNKKAVKAVTVKHKPMCDTCGKVNKANTKFCGECGTALALI